MTEELNTPMGVGISAKRGETQEAPKKVQEVPDQPQVEYNEPPQVVYEPVAPFRPVDYTPNQFREDAERKIRDDQTITDTTLRESPTFLNAATIIARKDYPDTWNEMTNEELTTSFLTKLNRNTYNIPRAVSTAMEYDEATPEEVAAIAYGMEMYEEKSPSWEGTAGAMWALASDPTVLGSIMSLGAGTVVREGAKRTAVTALRESLGKRMTALAAVDAGLWTGLDDAAQQNLRMAVDLQEGYDPVQGAMSAALGAAAGAGLWKGGQAVAKGMGNFMTNMEQEVIPAMAGGGSPTFDALLAGLDGKPIKEKQKQISANLRFLEGTEKQKAIAHLKDMTPKKKPKKPKKVVQEKITAREEFNEQFYSKLEHEVDKIPDDAVFTRTSAEEYLLSNGVKQEEIKASGVLEDVIGEEFTGHQLKNSVMRRDDKITKNTLDADTAGSAIEKDDYLDYISVDEGTSVSEGESGYGSLVRDEYTGAEIEVGSSYWDDMYVDESGSDIGDYDAMRDDWYEYYANDDHKSIAREQLTDEGIEIDADNLKERTFEVAENDSPWYDYYSQGEYWTNGESSRQFDTMDEAIEDAKETMYYDYENNMDYDQGEIFEGYTIDGGDDYRMEVYKMEDFKGDGQTHNEPHLEQINQEAKNVQVHARMKTRTDDNGKTGTVLEELQSQWEQDWRSQGGGKKLPTKEEKAVAQKEIDTIEKEAVKQEAIADEYANARSKIIDEKFAIRQKNIIDTQDEVNNLRQQSKDIDEQIAEIQKEYEANPSMGFEEPRARVKVLRAMRDKIDDKEEALTGAYKEDPRYIELESKQVGADYDYRQQKGKVNDIRNKQVPHKKIINAKPPSLSTPPISKRTQYEKLGIADNLLNSIKAGEDYFGFINGHIQNGARIDTTVGMSQAYDIEMPRIVQKMTGETPYMASFSDGTPVQSSDKTKIYWDGKKAAEDLEYYDNIGHPWGGDWYWRVDYTPEVKSKLKDAKMEVYGVGGLSLIGATQGEDNED